MERLLVEFTERFPNVGVYRGEQTAAEWLLAATEGMENREAATEELLLLSLANTNPAFVPFRELFDDAELKQSDGVRQRDLGVWGVYRDTAAVWSGGNVAGGVAGADAGVHPTR